MDCSGNLLVLSQRLLLLAAVAMCVLLTLRAILRGILLEELLVQRGAKAAADGIDCTRGADPAVAVYLLD